MRCAWGAWARGMGGRGFAFSGGFAVLDGRGTAKNEKGAKREAISPISAAPGAQTEKGRAMGGEWGWRDGGNEYGGGC
ncbi:MAG: hypothetical protein Q8M95_16675 [Candidatus Methanoperedens sp.]|nr:hypothetical protein [Candidatus Methanoperedens sp.]